MDLTYSAWNILQTMKFKNVHDQRLIYGQLALSDCHHQQKFMVFAPKCKTFINVVYSQVEDGMVIDN